MAETISPPLFREPLVERGPLTMSANWQRWLNAFWQQAASGTPGPPGPTGPQGPQGPTGPPGPALGTGAAMKVGVWQDSATMSYDTLLHYDSATHRLGIGNAGPGATLAVTGTMHVSGAVNLYGSLQVDGPIGQGTAPVAGYSFYGAYAGHFGGSLQVIGNTSLSGTLYVANHVGITVAPPTNVQVHATLAAFGTLSLNRGDAAARWPLDCAGQGHVSQLGVFYGPDNAATDGVDLKVRYANFDAIGAGTAANAGYGLKASSAWVTGRIEGFNGLSLINYAGTSATGIYSNFTVAGGTNRWFIYHVGDAPSYVGGALQVGGSASFSGQVGITTNTLGGRLSMGYPSGVYCIWLQQTDPGAAYPLVFLNSASGPVGSITHNDTTTFYNTTSDGRLKDAVEALPDALATVQALRPVRFLWTADGSRGHGLIAQEVQAVVEGVVSGDEASEMPLGIDYSKLVPWLIGAVQTLAGRVQALEGHA